MNADQMNQRDQRPEADPNMKDTKTTVVIAGAGPVGLAAACALWQRGVPARVLEAQDSPHRGSRAVQLHAPTLRVFRELGILDEAERQGLRIRANEYHLANGRTLRIELGALNEPLMLPQESTCALLERRLGELGGHVERGVEVTKIVPYEETVVVETEGPDGTARIEADWLVAADGVRSPIREQLGIDFAGSPVPVNFLLAEGRFEGRPADDAVTYFLGLAGSVVFASMPGERVRVSAAVPVGHPLTEEGVQQILDERGPGGLRIASLDMVNNFSSQERIAVRLREGRVFLAGDAAHTHSPLGGQGLNLGIQDVHNLAWKLAGVIKGTLNPAVLDSYEPERRHAAEQIVRNTHQFLKVFTLGPTAARVRNTVWSTLESLGLLRRWFAPLLAGWRVRYPADRAGGRLGGRRLPEPGTRSPHWASSHPDGDRYRLVTLGRGDREGELRGRALAGLRPALVSHSHVRKGGGGFLLLRPDGYVAACGSTRTDWEHASRLLAEVAAH
ncbi:FAD-dependent monooxygenase [Streptomyces sp. NPDC020898]|uniref:FAD-dependent monooxygenase n=1 Tax=Streptomyces sp. NPDC020898 TaxID=3365101 RepID=UPI0037AAC61F